MFPSHQGDEQCFEIAFDPRQQNKIQQDLILTRAAISGSNLAGNMGKGRPGKLISNYTSKDEMGTANNDHGSEKKMMHRNTERLRRQEMAILCASLRSLLPLELIKGKRSMSDHINEAVNYIKLLLERVRELGAKRDELKNLSNLSALGPELGSSSDSCCSVMIRPCLGGIEIVFSSSIGEEGLPLSRVLQVLLQEGISVVNCVSSRVNERLLHAVLTEVNGPSCLDLSALQQKLTLLAPSSSGNY